MPTNELLTERRGQSLIVTFNRPTLANSFTMDMANQMFLVLKNATTDRSVRAILLCGAANNFLGGLDESFYKGDMDTLLERANQLILPYHSVVRELQVMDKPVLAAVEGQVSGPGLSFMLASDLVIAAESTKICFASTRFGMSPDGAVSYFLTRKAGAGRAAQMMMLSEEIDGKTAQDYGIVNRVVPDARLHDEALAFLDRLTEGPTRAYGCIKKLVQHAPDHDLGTHLGLEHTFVGHSARSFDFREAVKSLAAGKVPKFTGT